MTVTNAAERVRAGESERFGLITTNSIVQTFNRQVVEAHLAAEPALGIVLAVPDHPWVDAYRKDVQARHPAATLTAMYNLLAKHRAREPFGAKDKALHVQVGTDELMRLHDELDRAVLDAYGWPHDLTDDALLDRLVALNAQRAEEERAGHVRWLRAPAAEQEPQQPALLDEPDEAEPEDGRAPWPADPLDQLADVLALVRSSTEPLDAESVATRFHRAPRKRVGDLLDRLATRRLLVADDGGRYRAFA